MCGLLERVEMGRMKVFRTEGRTVERRVKRNIVLTAQIQVQLMGDCVVASGLSFVNV
jgi:hypothetical protein